jgi:putative membrane protein
MGLIDKRGDSRMKTLWMFICMLLVALVTAMFAVINIAPVLVHLVFVDAELPLYVIILGSTLLGGLIVGFIGMIKQFKLKRAVKHLEKELIARQKEQAAVPVYVAPIHEETEPAPIHTRADQPAPYTNL